MLQTALSRIAGFSSFPIVIVILGAFGLLLLRLFPALGEFLAGLAEAITELFESIRLGCGPLGLLLLPLELLWALLRKVIELLWKLIGWLLDVLQSFFDLDGCGCGCAPLGCLMIPFALVGKLFGLGNDDGGSTGGSGAAGGGSRSRSSVGSTTSSATHDEAAQERTQSAAGERERSRSAGVGAALGAVGAAGSKAARAASSAVSGVTGAAVRGSGHSAASTSHRKGTHTKQRHTTRMVGKRASIPEQAEQSRMRRAVSGAVTGAKDAVAGAASEVKENVKAAVGASTDPDYFDDVPQRRAFASAWSITDPEDARDIAEILAEHGIEHSWQIDDETGLPTVTIPNHVAGQATDTLGEYGFDVGEGMPADYISVDRVHEAPGAGTVYDPEIGEWVTPEPEWEEGDTVPALEDRMVYDPDAASLAPHRAAMHLAVGAVRRGGTLYDPATDAHFDEETQGWYDADGEPVVGEPDVDSEAPGEQPALPPPNDEPDFWWGPQPEPVEVQSAPESDHDDVIDATYEDVPRQGGEQ